LRLLKGHLGKLRSLTYSPDGSKLATAGDGGATKLWDAATGRELATILLPGADQTSSVLYKRISHLAFSPDGTLLATGAYHVRLWDIGTAGTTPAPVDYGEGCPPMAFVPHDGTLILLWGGEDFGLRVGFERSLLTWSRSTNRIEQPFVQAIVQRENREALAVSTPADLLAVACRKQQLCCVRLWGLAGKEVRGKLDMPPLPRDHIAASVQELAFSPDGRSLAVAEGPRVAVFDVPGGRMRGLITAHAHQVASVAFSPHGRLLATASLDGSVRFWDADSLEERAAYNWKLGKMRGVRFHPDGMTAAAFGDKAAVVIWDVEGG
jgi:WD40 repeat protein